MLMHLDAGFEDLIRHVSTRLAVVATPAATLAAAALLLGLLYSIIQHFQDRNGLRRFPSPSLAASTPLWQMYHNWRDQKFLAVDRAHERWGSIVRIGPNHVSFASPQAFKEIYGHGTTLRKDTFYDNQAGGNPNMTDATDKHVHRGKCKNLAHVFAPGQITAMEPRVMDIAGKLVRDLERKSCGLTVAATDRFPAMEGVFDLQPWLNMFSYDAITAVFWSSSYGFLDRGNDDCIAERGDGSTSTVHAMHTFHIGAAHSVLIGHLPMFWYDLIRNRLLGWTHHTQCGNGFSDMARHLAKTRLRSPPTQAGLFSNLPTRPTAKRAAPMGMDEIVVESSVMLNAGNDTTQTSLTNTMFFLASHPAIQAKLRSILRQDPADDEIPLASYETLCHIPYLRAVLDESLRLQAPLGTGLSRLTTEPTTIDGELIPAGVTVSAPTWSLHRRNELFHRAEEYVPDRWLHDCPATSDAERQNLKEFVIPFSLGPRACIGRNLAYMELSICIAALILAFECELTEKGQVLRHHERFNCSPVELPIRAKYLLGSGSG